MCRFSASSRVTSRRYYSQRTLQEYALFKLAVSNCGGGRPFELVAEAQENRDNRNWQRTCGRLTAAAARKTPPRQAIPPRERRRRLRRLVACSVAGRHDFEACLLENARC